MDVPCQDMMNAVCEGVCGRTSGGYAAREFVVAKVKRSRSVVVCMGCDTNCCLQPCSSAPL